MKEKRKQLTAKEFEESLKDAGLGHYRTSYGHTTSTLLRFNSDGLSTQKFESVTSSGIKLEGDKFSRFYPSEVEAWGAYFHKELPAYINAWPKHYDTICIRELPEAIESFDKPGEWAIYSRLTLAPYREIRHHDQQSNIAPVDEVSQIDYLHPGWRTDTKGPNPANKSGFHATGHRILVEPVEVEKKTASGILLVDKTVDAEEQRSVVVRVLEIGPDAWADKSTDYCKVGDKILIGMYVGKFHTSPVDGKKYRFISDLDVITPITEEAGGGE